MEENPAVNKLDDERVEREFESLDFLVVQDVATTQTVDRADVVLSASVWAERRETVTNLDRQSSASGPSDGRRGTPAPTAGYCRTSERA